MKLQNLFRAFMVVMLAFGVSIGVANAGFAVPISGANVSTGTVEMGGNTNNNGTDQGNTQSQDQVGDQGQTVDQDNTNNLDQDNTGTANAGSAVSNDCDASLVEDSDSDDVAECASGNASAGDSSVGNTNQSNAGSQSGANSNSQSQTQNGGNQANAPRNTNTQQGLIDVTDIGGDSTTDDDEIDNDGTLDNSDNSQNNSGIQGNDNQVGGAEAISALVVRLFEILALILSPGGGDELPAGCTPSEFGFQCNVENGLPAECEFAGEGVECVVGDTLFRCGFFTDTVIDCAPFTPL